MIFTTFLDVKGAPGHHYFDYSNNMELVLVNYKPSLLKFYKRVCIGNYFYRQLNLKAFIEKFLIIMTKVSKNTYNNIDQKEKDLEAIDEFINYISINSNSNDILLS